jgi:membrane fusion protein (multidrug efflux system)
MTTQEEHVDSSPPKQQTTDMLKNTKRNRTFMIVSLAIASIGIGYVTYWLSYGRYHEYTDDAYVNGNAVMITAQVQGIITKIYAQDSDFVSIDTPLVQLDTTDHEIALEKVKKQLAETVREVAKLFADAGRLEAEIEEKKAIFIKNALDYERRASLLHTGSISQENFDHALSDMASTYYKLIATEQAFYGVMAQIENTSIQDHPRVETIKQLVRQAWVNLRRCTLYAPVTGIVAQRTIQVGRWVEPTQPLLSVVPLEQMWVDANFKEIQLSNMRVGQPVSFHVDMYGRRVEFSGTVAGIGGGTGSVFSALPPQNATGNWIKIVQRIPVRIDIPPAILQKHPLRLGLSVEATVKTKDRSGSMTPNVRPNDTPRFATNIYDKEEEGVDQVIEDIIQTNLSIYSMELDTYGSSSDDTTSSLP